MNVVPQALDTGNLRQIAHSAYKLRQARGAMIVVIACAVGVIAGALVTGMSWLVQALHWLLFGLPAGARLSAMLSLASDPGARAGGRRRADGSVHPLSASIPVSSAH